MFTAVWPFHKNATDSSDLAVDGKVPAPDAEEQGSTYDHGVVEAEKRKTEEGASMSS